MKNIKITTDRPEVSSEEIRSRQDFSGLMKNYKASKPFYKNGLFLSGAAIVLAGAIATILWLNVAGKKEIAVATKSEDSLVFAAQNETGDKPFIKPAFSNIEIPFQRLSVDAGKGGILKAGNGSVIRIPANAFKDANGKTLSGKIDIRYREFRDPVDMLVSGIPMGYDSAGTRYQLESAGMFEIMGLQNDKAVQIDKPLTVELASTSLNNGFNQYYLDTVSRNWKYLGRDKMKVEKTVLAVNAVSDSIGFSGDSWKEGDDNLDISYGRVVDSDQNVLYVQDIIEKIKKEQPVKPVKLKPANYRFDVDVLPNEFPELTEYKGLQFEVGPENKTFSDKLYAVQWDDVVLNYNTPGKNYLITFRKDGKAFPFVVYPVYEKKDSAKVMALYQTKFKAYEKRLSTRLAEEKKEKERAEAERKRLEAEWAARQKKMQEEYLKQSQTINYGNIRNSFSVSNFGIYNSDYPFAYNDRVTKTISFADETGKPIPVDIAYMIDFRRNSLFAHYFYNSKSYLMNYSPKSENMLFTVTSDNSLLIYSKEDFKNTSPVNGKHTFKLRKVEKKFSTVQEIKDFLLAKG